MAGEIVAISVALDASAEQLLFALRAGRFSDYSIPLGGAMLRMLRRMYKVNYDTGGSLATPSPWAPLSPRTLRDKKRLGYGHKPIMRRTDRLYRSLTLNAKTPDGVVVVTKDSLTVGTTVPYAEAHQKPKRGSRLPQRQIVPDPAPTSVAIEARQILRDWIVLGKGR